MARYLVIVESPTKVKTIKKFLGSNYVVMASNGHVRDLPKSQMGVDLEHDFEPKYITIRGKGEILAGLRKEVKKADINDFKKVVYSNVKGAPYKKDDDIKELLRQQIMSPVLFEKSIRDLINKGVDTFIEVGPGKALSGFVKKIDKSVKIYNVCDIDSLESTISNLEL